MLTLMLSNITHGMTYGCQYHYSSRNAQLNQVLCCDLVFAFVSQ